MSSPPRLAESLLRHCVPGELSREGLVGDLRADFHRIRAERGATAAWAWYWAQAIAVGLRFLVERLIFRGGSRKRAPERTAGVMDSRAGSSFFERVLQDVRYAARTFGREPGWTAATLVTLALGIGATTAIFTVVNGILIQPLDYPSSHRLVMLEYQPGQPSTAAQWARYDAYMVRHMSRNVAYPNFKLWREATADLFQALGVYDDAWSHDIGFGAGTGSERLAGTYATSGLFRALGVPPVHGRLFIRADDEPGAVPTVILSYGLWMRRFGGSPDVVGTTLTVRQIPHTIVGIMPRDFAFPSASAELWLSMATASRGIGSVNYEVVGRLRDGLSVDDARMAIRTRRILTRDREDVEHRYAADFVTLHASLVGESRPILLLFAAAVTAMLLIACVNVVNLMLTRATRRHHEQVVRAALGASPGRLARQLLTEGLVVSMLGAGLGLGLAFMMVEQLLAVAPGTFPRQESIHMDGTVLLFSAAVAVIVGVAVGLVPAVQASRARLVVTLSSGARGASAEVAQGRLRDGLVVLQLAVAMVLLVAGGLLSRSFVALLGEETGFDAQNVLTLETSVPSSRYGTLRETRQFYDDLLEGIRALPRVREAALVTYLPASGFFHSTELVAEGYTPDAEEEPVAEILQVSPGYFETLGMQILDGRDFNARDDESAPPIVAVSESLARAYFRDGRALGGRILRNGEWATIVGVIGDVRYRGAERRAPVIYEPYAASGRRSMDVVARVDGEPALVGPTVTRLVASLDPEVVVYGVLPLEARLWDAVSGPRFRTALLAAFGLVSMLLSVVGVYGVMAYMVGQRTREIGIRRVLGARSEGILGQVAGRGLTLTALGMALGLIAALQATELLSSYLYRLEPHDPGTLGLAAGVLGLASMVACFVPALRAARVDPMIALRTE